MSSYIDRALERARASKAAPEKNNIIPLHPLSEAQDLSRSVLKRQLDEAKIEGAEINVHGTVEAIVAYHLMMGHGGLALAFLSRLAAQVKQQRKRIEAAP